MALVLPASFKKKKKKNIVSGKELVLERAARDAQDQWPCVDNVGERGDSRGSLA